MKARNIFIGCGVLLLLCIVVGGIGFFTLGKSVINTLTNGPYEIGKRAMPADANQDTLLPQAVGGFTRGDVTTAANGFTATYTSGSDTVKASAGGFESVAAAQANIPTSKTGDGSWTISLSVGDPSFAMDGTQGTATKIIYSRGKYLFFFTASSASALEGFMTKFPY